MMHYHPITAAFKFNAKHILQGLEMQKREWHKNKTKATNAWLHKGLPTNVNHVQKFITSTFLNQMR